MGRGHPISACLGEVTMLVIVVGDGVYCVQLRLPSPLHDVLALAPLFVVMEAGTCMHFIHAQSTCSDIEHNILHATHGRS